ncbi:MULTISPECIES: MarR family winged helix-turn-helix transcriptional regulator [Streptacidiphilus]|uniref:MarR family winged helix-turn-helix transcriptional regulator n=1 Tax=Streptacidiphilus cavernicola TaxID=3342716 RepID=A0ABV6UW04_9ACTN|nr:MarR family transcriptional regulator [Streptacidiphilus jeojiense]
MGSLETPTEQQAHSLLLNDQLCFALYAASRAVTQRYRPLLEALGLTYPQYLVLLVLWEHGTVPIKDIGAALNLDYGTLTPLIKRLESAGLLSRERRPEDERTVLVTLTEQGRDLREQARAVPTAIGEAMGLTPSQFEQARHLLRLLTANVSAQP